MTRSAKRAAMKAADVEALADKLFRAKRRVYRRSLLELARSLGYEIKRPNLSDEVIAALQAEADDHARKIAATFNRDLSRAAVELSAGTSDDELPEKLAVWARSRQRARARPTAVTEAYSAHADSLVGAVHDLGIEARFDFGGRPSDSPPECSICEVLLASNPHPLEDVLAIGNPHIACAQSWHPTGFDQRDLPADPQLGQTLGGIVGGGNWLSRHGNDRERATRAIETMVAER